VLRRHAPFDAMAEGELTLLAGRLKLRYFPRGAPVVIPESGVVRELYIIQRGVVEGTPVVVPSFHRTAVTLGPGESFPIGALIGKRATTLRYVAVEDTFCYVLGEGDFRDVMSASHAFQSFCTQSLAHLLEQSGRQMREAFAARAAQELGMSSPLGSAVRRAPVVLASTARVADVLAVMKARRIGSVVLVDEALRPEGIFTHTDVLDRVALGGCRLEEPVSTVMTRDPVSLPHTATIADAAHRMAREGFRHILVMDGERLAGVISERDLFAMQRRSAQGLRKEIAQADTREWLAFAAREASGLSGTLLAQGIGAEPLMNLVTAMNDAITQRAVQIAHGSAEAAKLGFCWIGLGSEGRMEQTLATDQDNAIIFADAPPGGVEGARARLLELAAEVNDTLAECGFPLCAGAIMARNPQWCLTLAEWKERFDDWMRNANPTALLNAAIFFDLRALAGDAALARELQAFLLAGVPRRPAFLRQMAINALEVRPPLGFFTDIAVNDSTGGMLDLKLHASRPIVDCARILALAAAVPATSTTGRLNTAGPPMRMSRDEIDASVGAFHFVQMLRLRRQEEAEAQPLRERNRVDPDALNSLDRRILKEALRQARKLQNRIALEYQL
jgi:CBS domain-containing protein